METALTFNEVTLTPVTHENRLWVRAAELARALGYGSEKSISIIYARHKEEFSNDMSVVINLMTTDTPAMTRLFSPRGCHLIAMFARTGVAKQFRRWVLDVLDKVCAPESAARDLPPTDAPISPDQQCTLQAIVKAKIEALPEVQRKGRGLYPQVWSRFNNHFRLARYSQLPQCRMSEAVAYLTQMEIAVPSLPLSRPLTRPALPQVDALPPDALDAITGSQRAKRFRSLMEEVRCLARKVGSTMEAVNIATNPGAREAYLPSELNARYNALDQMHKIAVAGLYQAEHMLYCLYYMGEGVSFVRA